MEIHRSGRLTFETDEATGVAAEVMVLECSAEALNLPSAALLQEVQRRNDKRARAQPGGA